MPLTTSSRILTPFLDRLSDEELDAIPYGIVELDAMGTVRSFNRAEADNCGLALRPVGQNYFLDVAPSANAPEFYDRFLHAIESEMLDEEFVFTYACAALPRRVQVRLYYSKRTASLWIFTAMPDGTPLERAHSSIVEAIDAAASASASAVSSGGRPD